MRVVDSFQESIEIEAVAGEVICEGAALSDEGVFHADGPVDGEAVFSDDGDPVDGELVPVAIGEGGRDAPVARAPEGRRGGLLPSRMPAAVPAAAALGGFVAGATLMALARRAAARRLGRELPSAPSPAWPDRDRWAVGESRTFLVDVRLISRSGG